MQTVEDLAQHFADEFLEVSTKLKKALMIKGYQLTDCRGKHHQLTTTRDLREFLSVEMQELESAIDEIEVD